MMNQNYVRKCEEYLQNIPTQRKLPLQQQPSGGHRPPTSSGGSRNLSTRKLTQQPPSSGQEKQSINNPVAVVATTAINSQAGPRARRLSNSSGQQARSQNVGQEKQQGSKFIRPCCRQQRGGWGSGGMASRGGGGGRGKASDNVNQGDNMKLVESDGDYGASGRSVVESGEVPREDGRTETWNGILTSSTATGPSLSLSQMKSKPALGESLQVSSPLPPGPATLAPSITSTMSSSSRPVSSIAAVPPQPRPSVATLQASPHCKSVAEPEALHGINLFRFDPLRTLQFLTLELKSKLKTLCPEHRQLYKISKELLYAVKILTESLSDGQKSRVKCASCEQNSQTPAALNHPITKGTAVSKPETPECSECKKLQSELVQQSERHSHETQLLNEEINYLKIRLAAAQDDAKMAKEVASNQQQQQLEGEIKRLQAMISDKQTLEGGLIADSDRKLQEAASRCHRLEHARNEAEKRLLYATLENERLNFLLTSQSSTMTNLRSDFSTIQTLAHQQIDLLDDRTQRPSRNGPDNDATPSATLHLRRRCPPDQTDPIIIDNHHRNYRRHPSGSGGYDCSSAIPRGKAASAAEKVRKPGRYYSFKNTAEKESDDGNDANDLNQPPPTLPPAPKVRNPADGIISSGDDGKECSSNDHDLGNAAAAFQRHHQHRQRQKDEPGGTGSHLKLSAAISLTSTASESSIQFGQVKRALLIDSDCESLREDSSKEDIVISNQSFPINNNNNNRTSNLTTATTTTTIKRLPFPSNDGGMAAGGITDDDDDGYSKTNDCGSLSQETDTDRQLGLAGNRSSSSSSSLAVPENIAGRRKKDAAFHDGSGVGREKYPGDYGDKFERRESCLLLGRKELCQNRPIIGQIRDGEHQQERLLMRRERAVEAEEVEQEKVPGQEEIVSAANEPASARTEEFSIDFDDITLPSSPTPFKGARLSAIGCNLNQSDDK